MNKLAEEQSVFLDAIRGVAGLMVLIGHALVLYSPTHLFTTKYPIQLLAVVIFFILSGFLITYQFLTKKDYVFENYFIDRWSRIYTSFIPAILLISIFGFIFSLKGKMSGDVFIANLLMLEYTPFDLLIPWLPGWPTFGSGDVFWTLVLEWWFYMFFGVLFVKAETLFGIIIKCIVFPVALAVVIFFAAWENLALVWFAGSISAFIFCKISTTSKSTLSIFLLSTVWAVTCRVEHFNLTGKVNVYDYQFIFFNVIFFITSLFLVSKFKCIIHFFIFSKNIWKYLAFITYPLYLIHSTLQKSYEKVFGVGNILDLIMILVGPILVAILFSHIFEKRFYDIRSFIKKVFWGFIRKIHYYKSQNQNLIQIDL